MQISPADTNKDYNQKSASQKVRQRTREFLAKFNNDWMMFSAGSLAYNLMIAVVPIGIAVIAILGITVGRLSPSAQAELLNRMQNVFPSAISSQNILKPALQKLQSSSGFLSALAVVFAIFGGSRLFIAIEQCFDIVYRTPPRKAVPQNGMALAMMLVFTALIPIMVFASSAPVWILALAQNAAINQLPGIAALARNSFILSLAGILGGLIVAWILFQAIYMVVPHQHISFKNSWKGAIVAAALLEIFMALFPFYVSHFMSSYTGVVGFAVIFLLFFYYFAIILLLGGQVNAYFAENVAPLPDPLVMVLADAVGPRPEGTIAAAQEGATTQYTPSSQDDETETTRPEASQSDRPAKAGEEATGRPGRAASSKQKGEPDETEIRSETKEQTDEEKRLRGVLAKLMDHFKKGSRARTASPKPRKRLKQKGALMPTLVGTAVAFGITLTNLRRKTAEAERARNSTGKGRKAA